MTPIPTFRDIFDNQYIKLREHESSGEVKDIFKYMVDHTMHRPRDIVKFCQYVKEEASESRSVYYGTIKNALKSFSTWLVYTELVNEMNPVTGEVDQIFDLLRLLGRRPFSITDFNIRYKSVGQIKLDCDKLMVYLYDLGILYNISDENGKRELRSVFRNTGSLNRNMKLCIHPAVWIGINS